MSDKDKTNLTEVRQFGLMMGLVLTVLGALFYWKGRPNVSLALWTAATVMVGSGLLAPAALRPVFRVWMKFAHAMGWFNTHLLLVLLYFLIFTPMGLVMRLFRPDPLQRKIEKERPSYWKIRERSDFVKEQYERQF